MSVAPRDFEAWMKVCSRSERVQPRINWAEGEPSLPGKDQNDQYPLARLIRREQHEFPRTIQDGRGDGNQVPRYG